MREWRKENPEKLKAHRKKNDSTTARRKHFAKKRLRQRVRYQAVSELSAKERGADWTATDDAKVTDYTKTAKELARELGRTFWGIVTRRAFLRKQSDY